MAAIDPNTTEPTSPDRAAKAATRRRSVPTTDAPTPIPLANATPLVGPPADAPPPAAGVEPAPAGQLSPEALTKILAGLGYGAENTGPATVAHASDEGSLVELVDSGVVRLPVWTPDGPKTYRLRPPLFGEHKRLRGALQDVLAEIDQATIDLSRATAEVNAEREQARKIEDPVARNEAMAAVKAKQRKADDESDERIETLMVPWWELAFELCGTIDGSPDPHWGRWVLDHRLAADVINHWRTSPRVPGR
jgi:hypothetical protein